MKRLHFFGVFAIVFAVPVCLAQFRSRTESAYKHFFSILFVLLRIWVRDAYRLCCGNCAFWG